MTPTGRIAGTALRLRARADGTVVGLADQALGSGVNFLTLILVARALAPRDFGYFVLAFALLQSAGALQSALVTRPHNVLGAQRTSPAYERYTSAAAVLQTVHALAWSAVLLALAAISAAVGSPAAGVFLVAVPALVAWQLQEFARRVLYTEGRLAAALANDAVSYGGQALVLLWLWRADSVTSLRALAAIAATSTLGVLLGAVQLRRSLARSFELDSLRANWAFGRWLGAAEVAYWGASQLYIYLAAVVVGPAASGSLKAAQTLLGPASVYLAFFVVFLPTRFARDAGRAGESGRLRRGFLLTVPPTAAYGLLVAILAPSLLEQVYGSAYAGSATVVRLFAVYYVVLSVSDVLVASLAARRQTRLIFVAHAAGAAVSVACGWLLLELWGAAGGAGGMLASILVALAVLTRFRAAGAGSADERQDRRDDGDADEARRVERHVLREPGSRIGERRDRQG